MDEEEFEYEEEETIRSRRFRGIDLLVLALNTAYEFSMSVTNNLAIARNLAGMHANYRVDQDNFQRDAMLEIETITGEQEDV